MTNDVRDGGAAPDGQRGSSTADKISEGLPASASGPVEGRQPPMVGGSGGAGAAAYRAVPPQARRLVRYIIGFGVGVAVGLAPYLGLLDVPGFKALLTLIPDETQDRIIPLSASVMGVVAIVVQWYGWDKVTEEWLRKRFLRTLILLLLTLCAFIVIQRLVVLKVPIEGGEDYLSILVGFERRPHPRCPLEISTLACVRGNSADPAFIASLYSDTQLNLADLSLTFSYLSVTGLFGVLVGLLMLKAQLKEAGPEPEAEAGRG